MQPHEMYIIYIIFVIRRYFVLFMAGIAGTFPASGAVHDVAHQIYA